MKMLVKKAVLGLLIGALLGGSFAAYADRPEWAGRRGDEEGRGRRGDERDEDRRRDRRDEERFERRDDRHEDRRDDRREDRYGERRSGPAVEVRIGGYFGDDRRESVREYYREEHRGGRCPPGLAKKHNGCMPPGQARKWSVGQPLPRDVIYHTVDPQVRVRLGAPPAGHEFVRVAGDILLIAVGTAMVIDAIQDIQGR